MQPFLPKAHHIRETPPPLVSGDCRTEGKQWAPAARQPADPSVLCNQSQIPHKSSYKFMIKHWEKLIWFNYTGAWLHRLMGEQCEFLKWFIMTRALTVPAVFQHSIKEWHLLKNIRTSICTLYILYKADFTLCFDTRLGGGCLNRLTATLIRFILINNK